MLFINNSQSSQSTFHVKLQKFAGNLLLEHEVSGDSDFTRACVNKRFEISLCLLGTICTHEMNCGVRKTSVDMTSSFNAQR